MFTHGYFNSATTKTLNVKNCIKRAKQALKSINFQFSFRKKELVIWNWYYVCLFLSYIVVNIKALYTTFIQVRGYANETKWFNPLISSPGNACAGSKRTNRY